MIQNSPTCHVGLGPLYQQINEQISGWHTAMSAGDCHGAAAGAISAIRSLPTPDLDDSANAFNQFLWAARIVLNGLRDVANLSIVVSHVDWLEYPQLVERAWELLHDAKERLTDYVELDAEFLSFCAKPLETVFMAVKERYGHGIYVSSEILIESLACSICSSDFRGCDHIPGNWYGGQRCISRVEGLQPQWISLVEHPRDPRCRIWPWQEESKAPDGSGVYADIRILGIFHPDGDDDGGNVVAELELFASATARV